MERWTDIGNMALLSNIEEATEMARTTSPELSALVQGLELERPRLITLQALAKMVRAQGIATPPRIVAHRLRELGWLHRAGREGLVRAAREAAPA